MSTIITSSKSGLRRNWYVDDNGYTDGGKEVLIRYGSGFTKPDKPTINQPINGYRKPSSYKTEFTGIPSVAATSFGFLSTSSRGGPAGWHVESNAPFRARVTLSPKWDFNRVQHLRTKVLNNVRDEVVDVAMVLAEIGSTAGTATTLLGRLARSMLAVKRRNPESFNYLLTGRRRDGRRPTDRFLRETAGEYLQWKYGIMPTVYDIQGLTKALDMSLKGSLFDNPPLMVARSSVKYDEVVDVQFDQQQYPWGTPMLKLPVTLERELRARLDYRVSGEGLRGLNRYGIGLSSIPTVLFDKTPFTFVLNMAIPIADLIKAWGALAGVEVVGYCETSWVKGTCRGGSFLDPRESWLTHTLEGGDLGGCFDRRVFPTPPMPLPYVRNPVNVGNLSTVLALFTQLRRKS